MVGRVIGWMSGQKVSCSASNDTTAYFDFHSADQPKSPGFTEVCFAGGEPTMIISRFVGLLDIVMFRISLTRKDFEEGLNKEKESRVGVGINKNNTKWKMMRFVGDHEDEDEVNESHGTRHGTRHRETIGDVT